MLNRVLAETVPSKYNTDGLRFSLWLKICSNIVIKFSNSTHPSSIIPKLDLSMSVLTASLHHKACIVHTVSHA